VVGSEVKAADSENAARVLSSTQPAHSIAQKPREYVDWLNPSSIGERPAYSAGGKRNRMRIHKAKTNAGCKVQRRAKREENLQAIAR